MKLFSFLFKIISIIQFKIISFAPRKQNKETFDRFIHSVKTGIRLIGFILLLGLNFQGMGQHCSHGEPLRKGRIKSEIDRT